MNRQVSGFFKRFLPVAVFLIGGTAYLSWQEKSGHLDQVKARETLQVGLGSGVLNRELAGLIGDLHYLAKHEAFELLNSKPDPERLHRLEAGFANFMEAKPVYDQIRWLDTTGQEVIRVDQLNGKPALAPPHKLQNKGDRYYFSETMALEGGQVFVSPLDLNVERGAIESPFKPMLRFGTVLVSDDGIKRGMVMTNYLGVSMIGRFVEATGNSYGQVMLLNAQGYWLHATNPSDEWGFMFHDSSRTLAARYPESWLRIQGVASGQFEDGNGLWTFQSVFPRLGAESGISGAGRGAEGGKALAENEAASRWLVVSWVPKDSLPELIDGHSREFWTFASLFLILAALFIWRQQQSVLTRRALDERFRAIFDHAMVGMATSSPSSNWLKTNPALSRILGYSAEELSAVTWFDITHPEDLPIEKGYLAAIERGESDGYAMEKRFVRKSGAIIHAIVAIRAIRGSLGEVDYFVVIVEDISNWVLAENEWKASVDTLQRFIDHLPGAAYVKDADSRILVASRGFESYFGLQPSAMIGRLTSEVFSGEFGQKITRDDARVLATGVTETINEEFSGRLYETTKFEIQRPDGRSELGGMTLDVTARVQSERNLEQQVRRSAVLLELPKVSESMNEHDFMQFALERAEELTQSKTGFIHLLNDEEMTIELVAWSRNTLEKYCTASLNRHYPINEAGIWADAARTKQPVIVNDYASAPNRRGLPEGHSSLKGFLSVPVIESGVVRMITGVGNKDDDYTDFDVETVQLIGNETWRIVQRQRAEQSLRLAMQVVNASPVVCFRWAPEPGWPVIFASENVTQWGYSVEDLLARRPLFVEIVHPDDRDRLAAEVQEKLAQGAVAYTQEYRLITASGQQIWVMDRTAVHRDDAGLPIYFDGVLTDISERKHQQLALSEALDHQTKLNRRLEEAHNQLLQSEKMASIGQLAAGVAHELNNPIGFVNSNLGTLSGYVRDLIDIISAYEEQLPKQEGSPGNDCLRKLLKEKDYEFLKDDIGDLLVESRDGLGRAAKIIQDLKGFSRVGEKDWREADIHQGIDSTLNIVWNELKYKVTVVKEYGDIPPVVCLASQLNQVFMNLLVNAGHAIEDKGTITIRTRRHGESEVCIEVVDTGKGIAKDHLNRIFEPFFTTKPVGKGTGLGLSLSYTIIERHHGRIEVESALGLGSTFRIILPIRLAPDAGDPVLEKSS